MRHHGEHLGQRAGHDHACGVRAGRAIKQEFLPPGVVRPRPGLHPAVEGPLQPLVLIGGVPQLEVAGVREVRDRSCSGERIREALLELRRVGGHHPGQRRVEHHVVGACRAGHRHVARTDTGQRGDGRLQVGVRDVPREVPGVGDGRRSGRVPADPEGAGGRVDRERELVVGVHPLRGVLHSLEHRVERDGDNDCVIDLFDVGVVAALGRVRDVLAEPEHQEPGAGGSRPRRLDGPEHRRRAPHLLETLAGLRVEPERQGQRPDRDVDVRRPAPDLERPLLGALREPHRVDALGVRVEDDLVGQPVVALVGDDD